MVERLGYEQRVGIWQGFNLGPSVGDTTRVTTHNFFVELLNIAIYLNNLKENLRPPKIGQNHPHSFELVNKYDIDFFDWKFPLILQYITNLGFEYRITFCNLEYKCYDTHKSDKKKVIYRKKNIMQNVFGHLF